MMVFVDGFTFKGVLGILMEMFKRVSTSFMETPYGPGFLAVTS